MGTRSIRRLCRLLAVAALGLVVLAPVAAWAQTDGYPTTSTTPTTNCAAGVAFVVHGAAGLPAQATNTAVDVCGTSVTRPPGVTVKAASVTNTGGLAFTGGNIALLVGLGLVAAVGGVILVRLGRRPHATR
jgi:hypothetical protein